MEAPGRRLETTHPDTAHTRAWWWARQRHGPELRARSQAELQGRGPSGLRGQPLQTPQGATLGLPGGSVCSTDPSGPRQRKGTPAGPHLQALTAHLPCTAVFFLQAGAAGTVGGTRGTSVCSVTPGTLLPPS